MTAVELSEIHEANARYHDLAAAHYDAKWAISYGERGQGQVTGKLAKALGRRPGRYHRGLEIGAGTGYFGLNLMRAGVVDELAAVDISPGMLSQLERSAQRLGLRAECAACEAGALPFPDDSFDLVFGHAVLHHLPDLEGCLREFRRVLRPGGVLAFCGEPSFYGDRLVSWPKRAAHRVAPLWRAAVRAGARAERATDEREEDVLEQVVDVHAFTPAALDQAARCAGFEKVRVSGEELAAGLFGWVNRTLEGSAEPAEVPWLWRQYAYRGYLALQALDRAILEPRLPPALCYNLLVSARP
ncbi:MAG: class I SAM-dependent methyltransferase [Actinomycetota bacterium]|nr:class I SAM-dependent methyltransferase [Actinomycetota bacterium]